MILFLISKILSILEFYKNWGYTLILKNKGLNKMKEKILLTIWLILGVMLVILMLAYSLDSELESIEQQDRNYQEYIQRESLK